MHPFIHVTDTFNIPTYILLISLTYCLGLIWADRRAGEQGRSRNMALDIALAIMVGGFIGARLFHVFYEYPEVYLAEPARIFKFWEGGFVFYGGFIGAVVATYFFIKWRQESFWEWADFYAPVLAFGYAIGRLGCFFNGCCYGGLCDLPWAVEFTSPGLPGGLRHPTQLYATFFELVVLFVLLRLEKKWRGAGAGAEVPSSHIASVLPPGTLFCAWLLLHSIGRLFMEHFREDFRGPELGLSVSSWFSIALFAFSARTLFKNCHAPKPKKL
jgi:phosphatidylglycerol---prolipoprotein diacylglyceryl transferase